MNLLIDSLKACPLKPVDGKKPNKSIEEWQAASTDRWHIASNSAKKICEDAVLSLLSGKANSELFRLINSSVALGSKVQQLLSELWLWFNPVTWPRMTEIIMQSFEWRQPQSQDYLRPSLFLLGTLRECGHQLSAGPESFGPLGSTNFGRRSAWELGRITSAQRTSLATELSVRKK